MNQRAVLGGLVLTALICLSEGSSPVVLWTLKRIGGGNVESNLNEFSTEQFADLLGWKSEHGSIPIIAFGLNSLSLEDLTSQGGIGSPEPYKKLRRLTEASAETLLLPAVQSASDAMAILQRKGFNIIEINAGDALPPVEKSNTIVVVLDKPSVNMDDEIVRVFSKYTLEYPNLVGMLWGKQSTWSEEPEDDANNEVLSRSKRQADKPKAFILQEKDVLLYVEAIKLTVRNPKGALMSEACGVTTGTVDAGTNNKTLTLTAACTTGTLTTTNFQLVMNMIDTKLKYYTLDSMTASITGKAKDADFDYKNVALRSQIDLTVPIGLSFHCSNFGILYPREGAGNFSLELQKLQLEYDVPKEHTSAFSPEYDCVGFFTPGIWCGIVVTIMLLAILTWGMQMLMDVKTMDRFDDPKGKPISFGAGE